MSRDFKIRVLTHFINVFNTWNTKNIDAYSHPVYPVDNSLLCVCMCVWGVINGSVSHNNRFTPLNEVRSLYGNAPSDSSEIRLFEIKPGSGFYFKVFNSLLLKLLPAQIYRYFLGLGMLSSYYCVWMPVNAFFWWWLTYKHTMGHSHCAMFITVGLGGAMSCFSINESTGVGLRLLFRLTENITPRIPAG